jgi:hypothetical protein
MIKVFVTGRFDYEYSLDGSNFQISHQFTNIIGGKYTVHVRDKMVVGRSLGK